MVSWRARPRWAVFTGHGIGDMLWGGAYTEKLSLEVPETIWTYYTTHRWREVFFSRAQFEVYPRLQQSDAYLHCIPREVFPGDHPLDAYHRRAVFMHGLPSFGPFPHGYRFFGQTPRIVGGRVGAFRAKTSGLKTCPAIGKAVDLLRKLGYVAEETPIFSSGEEALSWLAGCSAFVGPETGLTHLAAAVGVPTVFVLDGRYTPDGFFVDGNEYVWANDCRYAPCLGWKRNAPCRRGRARAEVETAGYPCLRALKPYVVLDRILAVVERSGTCVRTI